MPLNVLPSMTNPPVAGSRAPRWMLDSLPVRRPEPHSTASTTRSRVCTGLTFSQPAPRRPASYGAVERLRHHALVAGGQRRVEEPLRRVGVGGDQPVDPLSRRARSRRAPRAARAVGHVEQVDAVEMQQVEEEHRQRLRRRGRPRRRPCGRTATR